MESMLDSEATSLEEYCKLYNIKVNTFRTQLQAIKKEVSNYYEECTKAVELWEKVKKHFKENKEKLKSQGIAMVAKSNVIADDFLHWNGKEDPEIFNERVRAEIKRLEGLLIHEEDFDVPEIPFDENYWDNLSVLNYT